MVTSPSTDFTGSRAEVLAQLGTRHKPLSLSQMRTITRHLDGTEEPRIPVRAAVLHTYTTELLQPYWIFESSLQGLDRRLMRLHTPPCSRRRGPDRV